MADDLTGNIRIGDSVLYQELEDEVVLLNMENQEYYGLNDVGARKPDVLEAIKAVQERKKVIKQRTRKSDKFDAKRLQEARNVFGSRLKPLDFHEKLVSFDEKWS